MRQYYVYLMANKRNGVLYTGVTNNMKTRVYQHKHGLVPGFTSRYNLIGLVHFEVCRDVRQAIAREEQIKGWTRAKKVGLIELENPRWEDLAD